MLSMNENRWPRLSDGSYPRELLIRLDCHEGELAIKREGRGAADLEKEGKDCLAGMQTVEDAAHAADLSVERRISADDGGGLDVDAGDRMLPFRVLCTPVREPNSLWLQPSWLCSYEHNSKRKAAAGGSNRVSLLQFQLANAGGVSIFLNFPTLCEEWIRRNEGIRQLPFGKASAEKLPVTLPASRCGPLSNNRGQRAFLPLRVRNADNRTLLLNRGMAHQTIPRSTELIHSPPDFTRSFARSRF